MTNTEKITFGFGLFAAAFMILTAAMIYHHR